MILEENNEDLTIFEGEKNTHQVDMMGHVIHIFHIFFIFVSWNYLCLECLDDVSPSSLWSSNHSGFPLEEDKETLHQENEQVLEVDKWKEEPQLELSPTFSTLNSIKQNLLEKVRSSSLFFLSFQVMLLKCLLKFNKFFLDPFSPSSSSSCSLVILAIWGPLCRKTPTKHLSTSKEAWQVFSTKFYTLPLDVPLFIFFKLFIVCNILCKKITCRPSSNIQKTLVGFFSEFFFTYQPSL